MNMEKITAFVFAAGLGTRLYPLTADRSKAMVLYHNRPLIEHAINKIIEAGIHDIVINVHHFPDQIIEFVHNHHFDARIRFSDERAYLRDTAGGLKFAEPFLKDSHFLLLYNVDILTDLDLREMFRAHLDTKSDVTLAVRDRKTSRYFVFDSDNLQLCGWKNVSTEEQVLSKNVQNRLLDLAFSGVHIMNTDFVQFIPSVEKSSLTPLYLQLMDKHKITGFLHQKDQWMDVGKYEEFKNILT